MILLELRRIDSILYWRMKPTKTLSWPSSDKQKGSNRCGEVMKCVFAAALAILLLAGCASYSPGEFDYSGPYPVIRFADGTVYELPSGNGRN